MEDVNRNLRTALPLLELRGVFKSYGKNRVLNGIDIRIMPGEVVGLLGDNGAGKSTFVKIMSGVVRPDRCSVYQDGQEVRLESHGDAEELGIETIYQDNALVDSMSIWRNMFLSREVTGPFGFLRGEFTRKKTMEMLENALEISGLDDPDKPVGALSGGQKQAVAIARAVHFRKRIVLFDEPTSALSVRETENVLKSIKKLRDEGVSSVFITHNLYHAKQVCDRFVVLARGRKLLDVASEDITLEELTRVIVEKE